MKAVPFGLLFASPEARHHLANAGREFALALRAGMRSIATRIHDAGLAAEYPYLDSALANLTATVEEWISRGVASRRGKRTPRRKG